MGRFFGCKKSLRLQGLTGLATSFVASIQHSKSELCVESTDNSITPLFCLFISEAIKSGWDLGTTMRLSDLSHQNLRSKVAVQAREVVDNYHGRAFCF